MCACVLSRRGKERGKRRLFHPLGSTAARGIFLQREKRIWLSSASLSKERIYIFNVFCGMRDINRRNSKMCDLTNATIHTLRLRANWMDGNL